jgi:hypothetical protein
MDDNNPYIIKTKPQEYVLGLRNIVEIWNQGIYPGQLEPRGLGIGSYGMKV